MLVLYHSAYTGRSTPITVFDRKHNADTLNICMKVPKKYYGQNGSYENFDIFQACFNKKSKRGYACSMIVFTRADQHLPQLLMELFDTLYTQC